VWKYEHLTAAPSDFAIAQPPPSTKEAKEKKFPFEEGEKTKERK